MDTPCSEQRNNRRYRRGIIVLVVSNHTHACVFGTNTSERSVTTVGQLNFFSFLLTCMHAKQLLLLLFEKSFYGHYVL